MSSQITSTTDNLTELLKQLGGVSLDRIQFHPSPGTATEADLPGAVKLCELVHGTLVQKPLCLFESRINSLLANYIFGFVEERELGMVTGPNCAFRFKRNVRLPDIAYMAWSRFESRKKALSYNICPVCPELVVEILSEGNTQQEVDLKLAEYLEAGVELIWIVCTTKHNVTIHRADGSTDMLTREQALSGEKVLPGFKLEISKFL